MPAPDCAKSASSPSHANSPSHSGDTQTSPKSPKAPCSNPTPSRNELESDLNPRWSQLPVTAAGSPHRDRGLDGAPDQPLPPRACARTQHRVPGSHAATARRSLEAQPRLIKEATSAHNHQTRNHSYRRKPAKTT